MSLVDDAPITGQCYRVAEATASHYNWKIQKKSNDGWKDYGMWYNDIKQANLMAAELDRAELEQAGQKDMFGEMFA